MTERNRGLQQLKQQLRSGRLGKGYIFYGEESYLRSYYLEQVEKALVSDDLAAFNAHKLEGKGLTVERLSEQVEAMPMLSERTLVTVTDWDLFKLSEAERSAFIALLADWPEYCCLILVYDLVEYKPNKTYKKLMSALETLTAVEFPQQERTDLLRWMERRFAAHGKQVEPAAAEYLLFAGGSLMTGLIPEIEKVAAYAKGEAVTERDVMAVVEPMLEAAVFELSNSVVRGNYDEAAQRLGQLLRQQEEPIMLLAVLAKELRRIYTARIAIDCGRDKRWLMTQWGMRSEYPARLLWEGAQKVDGAWCRESLRLCSRLDERWKSEKGIDPAGELKLLLAQLAWRRAQ